MFILSLMISSKFEKQQRQGSESSDEVEGNEQNSDEAN